MSFADHEHDCYHKDEKHGTCWECCQDEITGLREKVGRYKEVIDSLKEIKHGCWRDAAEVVDAVLSVRLAALANDGKG